MNTFLFLAILAFSIPSTVAQQQDAGNATYNEWMEEENPVQIAQLKSGFFLGWPPTAVQVVPSAELWVTNGSAFNLSCQVEESDPRPQVLWFRNDTRILPDAKFNITDEGHRLVVNSAEQNDMGTFECRAGNASDSVEVRMGVPPSIEVWQDTLLFSSESHDRVEMECRVTGGVPPPFVQWFKDGYAERSRHFPIVRRLENGTEQWVLSSTEVQSGQIPKARLSITMPTQHNAGAYECRAENALGSVVSELWLGFGHAPTIEASSGIVYARRNSTATLPCRTLGVPKPHVRWEKNGQPIEGQNNTRFVQLANDSLLIKNVLRSDEGNYTCVAHNQFGERTKHMTLLTVMVNCEGAGIEKGKLAKGRLRYKCQAVDEANTLIGIKWRVGMNLELEVFNDYNPNSSDRQQTKKALVYVFLKNLGAWLENAHKRSNGTASEGTVPGGGNTTSDGTVSDGTAATALGGTTADYAPVAGGAAPDRVARRLHSVLPTGEPPSIEVSQNMRQIVNGRTVTLGCRVTGGVPPTHIRWFKDGGRERTLPMDQEVRDGLIPVGEHGWLTILSADIWKHAGVYECRAENALGSVVSELWLDMPDVPTFEPSPDIEFPNANRTATLPCSPRGYPEPTVRWYKNWRYIPTRDRGSLIGRIDMRVMELFDKSLRIKDVQASDEGNYMCFARNPFGQRAKYVTLAAMQVDCSEQGEDQYRCRVADRAGNKLAEMHVELELNNYNATTMGQFVYAGLVNVFAESVGWMLKQVYAAYIMSNYIDTNGIAVVGIGTTPDGTAASGATTELTVPDGVASGDSTSALNGTISSISGLADSNGTVGTTPASFTADSSTVPDGTSDTVSGDTTIGITVAVSTPGDTNGTSPGSSAIPESTNGTTPGSAPSSSTPNGTASDSSTPNGTASDSSTPSGTASDSSTPNGTASDSSTPNETASDSFTPNGTASDSSTPNGTASDSSTPSGGTTSGDTTGAAFNSTVSGGTTPGSSASGGSTLGGDAPDNTANKSTLPDATTPPAGDTPSGGTVSGGTAVAPVGTAHGGADPDARKLPSGGEEDEYW